VQGNYIGANATGTSALPNSLDGIFLNGNNGALIGGTVAGAGNLISANGRNGVSVSGTVVGGFDIQGNRISTAADGVTKLGNAGFGVSFRDRGRGRPRLLSGAS
jgi:hypothetical protein